MNVFQIRIKIYLLKNINLQEVSAKVTYFIDHGLVRQTELLKLHKENCFKSYCFDLPYPLEKEKVYLQGNTYTITIRTVDRNLAEFFSEVLVNTYTDCIKGLTAELRVIPKKPLEKLISITPAVLKDEKGYWRSHMSTEEFKERLEINLFKKWRQIEESPIEESLPVFTGMDFINRGPIPVTYKGITLLGDKVYLYPADNDQAQNLAYMALGTGLLESNARSFGFVNYRFI